MDEPANPYAPPAGDTSSGWQWRHPWLKSFTVGDQEKHRVDVHVSPWTGWETYRVDGQVVHSTLTIRGPVELLVGIEERHHVRFDIYLTGRVILTVDGNLVDRDLFRELRLLVWAFVMLGIATAMTIAYVVIV